MAYVHQALGACGRFSGIIQWVGHDGWLHVKGWFRTGAAGRWRKVQSAWPRGLAAYRKKGLPVGASRWKRVGTAMRPRQFSGAMADGRKVKPY